MRNVEMWACDRGSLPAAAQRFVELHKGELLAENGFVEADLCIEITTLGIEHVEVTDVTVDVLQVGQLVVAVCGLFEFLP